MMHTLEIREKAQALFEFLKEVVSLSQTQVTDVTKQVGYVFLRDFINEECVSASSRDTTAENECDYSKYLIRFHKPEFHACPVPNEILVPWLEEGWQDYRKKLVCKDVLENTKPSDINAELEEQALPAMDSNENTEAVEALEPEHFADNPDRIAAFDVWFKRRNKWVDEQKHIEKIRELFNDLYDMYMDVQQRPGALELMLGNGILTDRNYAPEKVTEANKKMEHPVFLKQVRLELDAVNNTIFVYDTDLPPELYMSLFSAVQEINPDMLSGLQKQATDKYIHPLDHAECRDLLSSISHSISADGAFVPDEDFGQKRTERIIISWNPVLLVRKRPDGTIKAIEDILKAIANGIEIPASLLGILGVFNTPADPGFTDPDIGSEGPVLKPWATDLPKVFDDEDILLPKPANQEQMNIARKIEREPAVVVQGPPGTGKTHTIANLLGHFLAQGKTVLVTSQTTKALTVLRDKVPDAIRDLCVAVMDDQQGKNDMEASVNQIVDFIATHDVDSQARLVEDRRKARHHTYTELQKAKSLASQIRYKEFEPISYLGESFSPSRAAALLSEHREEIAALRDDISIDSAFPLSEDELNSLYGSNGLLSIEEEKELSSELPDPCSLIDAKMIESGLELRSRMAAKLADLSEACNLHLALSSDGTTVFNEDNNQIVLKYTPSDKLAALQQALSVYKNERPVWAIYALADGMDAGFARKQWETLLNMIDECYEKAQPVLEDMMTKPVKLLNNASWNLLLSDFEEMKNSVKKGGLIRKAKLIVPKNWKEALASVTINGVSAETEDDLRIIIAYLKMLQERSKLSDVWNRLMAKNGAPDFEALGDDPERSCYQYRLEIRFWLNWYRISRNDLFSMAEASGMGSFLIDPIKNLQPLKKEDAKSALVWINQNMIPAADLLSLQRDLTVYESQKSDSLELLAASNHSETCNKLYNALQADDIPAYIDLVNQLKLFYSKRDSFAVRKSILLKLSDVAPLWTSDISSRSGIHSQNTVPVDFASAWELKKLQTVINQITSMPYQEAEKKVTELTKRYREETELLASDSAWLHLLKRVAADPSLRQSLTLWSQAVLKLGKGTGKGAKTQNLLQEIRSLMIKCQKAVPAWIMPVATVMKTVNPVDSRFDVVIIDEASQSGISATAILYMGHKVIVVGDKEQVSPLSVGMDNTKLIALQDALLKGKIEGAALWDGSLSLYDIASQIYPPLMLKEHFRCVPEIIGYSNMLSYNGKIKPLREESSSPLKTATVSYRVNGQRKDKSKTNKAEAEAVVALLEACLEDPIYENQTFGVISLLGDDQVKLINRMILNHISMKQIQDHEILCSNASGFQGDERDVIFLTLVDSNEQDGPLPLQSGDGAGSTGYAMKQRYNVAVSRARNQLWVVHSLDRTKDLKANDMRYRLLEYVENPGNYKQQMTQIEVKAESPFEKEVAENLISRGYHIVQQWPVGAYRIDMVAIYQQSKIAIECDGEQWHSSEEQIRNDMERQAVLERLGWRFIRIRGSEFYQNKDSSLNRVVDALKEYGIMPEKCSSEDLTIHKTDEVLQRVKLKAQNLLSREDTITESGFISGMVSETIPEVVISVEPVKPVVESSLHDESVDATVVNDLQQDLILNENNLLNYTVAVETSHLGIHPYDTTAFSAHFPSDEIVRKQEEERTSPPKNQQISIDDVITEKIQPAKQQYAEVTEVPVPSRKMPKVEQQVMTLPKDDLLAALDQNGFEYIDNRASSDIVWVIYDKNKVELLNSIICKFNYRSGFEKRGSVVTRNRPAWRIMTK